MFSWRVNNFNRTNIKTNTILNYTHLITFGNWFIVILVCNNVHLSQFILSVYYKYHTGWFHSCIIDEYNFMVSKIWLIQKKIKILRYNINTKHIFFPCYNKCKYTNYQSLAWWENCMLMANFWTPIGNPISKISRKAVLI